MSDFDSAYHRLFSQPEFVVELLRDLIGPPWLDLVDLTTLERVNVKLHGEGLRAKGLKRREGDMLWRVRRKDGRDVYLLLLLEFQSTDDPWMPVRLVVYIGHIFEHLVQEGMLSGGLLPPIFPVVLYNGRKPWRTPTSLAPLIDLPRDSPLRDFQPNLSYHLIDQRRLTLPPRPPENALLPTIVRLERCDDGQEGWGLIAALAGLLKGADKTPLRRAVADFLNASDVMPNVDLEAKDFHHLLEGGQTMLSENAKRWYSQWREEGIREGRQAGILLGRQEGRQEGRLEGRQEGRLEGRQEGLEAARNEGLQRGRAQVMQILESRFGTCPQRVKERLDSIQDLDALSALTVTAATASSLKEVLGATPPSP